MPKSSKRSALFKVECHSRQKVCVYVSNMSDLMGWNFHGEAMFEIAALSSGMLLQ